MEWQNPPYSLTDESDKLDFGMVCLLLWERTGPQTDQEVIAKKHAALVELRLVP